MIDPDFQENAVGALLIARREHPAKALVELGRLFAQKGIFDLAHQCFDSAYRDSPLDPNVRRSLGLSLLRQGRLAEGLRHYEARWQLEEFRPVLRPFSCRQWEGEPISGKSILLWGEQGVGDQLMQARCLDHLLAAGARVTLECDPKLIPLFDRRHKGVTFYPQSVQPHPKLLARRFDFQSSLLSAWRWTLAGASLPAAEPYLSTDRVLVEGFKRAWRERNWPVNVGITWRSRAKKIGAEKSIDLALLRPLLADPRITVHSLQYGVAAGEIPALAKKLGCAIWVDREGDSLNNLDRLAAQIAALDLVISVSNATVHLAGACGVPTWVLLRAGSDWRWGESGEVAWLYRSMRLFRQAHPGTWSDVVARLCFALDEWLAAAPRNAGLHAR